MFHGDLDADVGENPAALIDGSERSLIRWLRLSISPVVDTLVMRDRCVSLSNSASPRALRSGPALDFLIEPVAMPHEALEASCRTGGRTCTARLEKAGFTVIGEAFADRRYESGGSPRSRKHSDAVIEDPVDAARQAVDIICRGGVKAAGGDWLTVRAQMLCIYGDTKNAAVIAAAVRRALEVGGVQIGAFSSSHH